MTEGFEGQVAVVTGAGSGIGEATAAAFAREGATVVIADRDLEAAERVAGELTDAGWRAEAKRVDVTDESGVAALAEQVTAAHGGAEVVVNNAGVCQMKKFLELTPADLRRMWEVHALGAFLVSRAFLPAMVAKSYGRIVNVTSGKGGFAGSPITTHYQSAKSAQTSLTIGMAAALARSGVTANCVSPGLVVTPLWDGLTDDIPAATDHSMEQEVDNRLADPYGLGRSIRPDEIARAILFLAHPDAGAITGRTIDV